jgi:hypothetical protein
LQLLAESAGSRIAVIVMKDYGAILVDGIKRGSAAFAIMGDEDA